MNVVSAIINLKPFVGLKIATKPKKSHAKFVKSKSIKLGFVSTTGSAPSMKMDDNQRIDKPHNTNGFQDVMERVANAAAVKGTKYEKRIRDKFV